MANPLYDTLFARHQGSERPFLHLAGGETLSYDAFLRQAARIANVFAEMGLEPGQRVAVQVAKSPEALAVCAACAQAGLVFLPLNTAYTQSEISYFLEDSGASLFICGPGGEAKALRVETLDATGGGSLMARAADLPETAPVAGRGEDDLAAFLYTSGTTGRSKGAMLSQRNLLSNAATLTEHWRFAAEDRLLHALPIFHTHGLFVATNVTLTAGGAMIFLPKFDLDAMIGLMPQATTMMGVPTFYTRLLDDPRFTADLTAHMRLFISGSAPLLAETHVQFEARTGHRILERYGMTETGMNTSNPYDGERRAGTVGFPLPGIEARVCDAEGRELPQGEIGQIEVRGPNVFQGYWNMPEKTKEELRPNGFFLTGDLGRVDADSYLHIVGRSKDLIISGGYNIYPKEIELLLDAQPGVKESAVIGLPHADFGEQVVGVVVPDGDAAPDAETLLSAIAPDLARFKQPRRIEILAELPRNSMGKVQKNVLRDRFS
ncbi:MAG: malonyl-CoA synthase [Pseudomonadota bacterium]